MFRPIVQRTYAFLEEAATYGDLYVGIGSDQTIMELKHHQPVCSELERLYMVNAIRFKISLIVYIISPKAHRHHYLLLRTHYTKEMSDIYNLPKYQASSLYGDFLGAMILLASTMKNDQQKIAINQIIQQINIFDSQSISSKQTPKDKTRKNTRPANICLKSTSRTAPFFK